MRTKRWMSEMGDVPTSFDSDQLLRSIAANTRIQAQAARTTAGWVTFIGLVVLGQVILVALVVFGGITLETT